MKRSRRIGSARCADSRKLSGSARPLPLAAAGFRKELALGFKPIGTRVSRQRKSVPPFRNEIRTKTNLFFGWLGLFSLLRGFWRLFLRSLRRAPFARRPGVLPAGDCGPHRGCLVRVPIGRRFTRRDGLSIFASGHVAFSRHNTHCFDGSNSITEGLNAWQVNSRLCLAGMPTFNNLRL